jgi:hypothetical protein
MFTRQVLVHGGEATDKIMYDGMYALNERPPIRKLTGMQGLGSWGGLSRTMFNRRRNRLQGLPGMGCMASRSLSGPGIGELADLADDTEAPPAPAPVPTPAPTSKMPMILGIAALLGAGFFLMKRK